MTILWNIAGRTELNGPRPSGGRAWRIAERATVRRGLCATVNTVPDANIGSLFGIGFPGWTGGVIQFINGFEGGLPGFVARARELAERYGRVFTPPESLVAKAERVSATSDRCSLAGGRDDRAPERRGDVRSDRVTVLSRGRSVRSSLSRNFGRGVRGLTGSRVQGLVIAAEPARAMRSITCDTCSTKRSPATSNACPSQPW